MVLIDEVGIYIFISFKRKKKIKQKQEKNQLQIKNYLFFLFSKHFNYSVFCPKYNKIDEIKN